MAECLVNCDKRLTCLEENVKDMQSCLKSLGESDVRVEEQVKTLFNTHLDIKDTVKRIFDKIEGQEERIYEIVRTPAKENASTEKHSFWDKDTKKLAFMCGTAVIITLIIALLGTNMIEFIQHAQNLVPKK